MAKRMSTLLSRTEAADYLTLSAKTLAQWAWRGEGPPVYKIGGRARYKVSDLDEYIEAQRVERPAS